MQCDRQWKITVCQIVCMFVPTILLPIYLVGKRLSGVSSPVAIDKIMFYKELNNVWRLILKDGLGLQRHDRKQISMWSCGWSRNKAFGFLLIMFKKNCKNIAAQCFIMINSIPISPSCDIWLHFTEGEQDKEDSYVLMGSDKEHLTS